MTDAHNKLTVGGLACLGIALLAVGVYLLLGWAFRWAWNYVAADALGAPTLTYWQSMAAVVLLSLVGNFFRSSGGSK